MIAGNARKVRSWGWLVICAAIFGWLHFEVRAQRQPASNAPSSTIPRATTQGTAEDYVGAEACAACHSDQAQQVAKTVHARISVPGSSYGTGCESCHGPGAEHVAAGGDKFKIFFFKGARAAAISKQCLTCHQYGEEHSNFERSAHSGNDVSCTDCHSPHHAQQPQFLLVKKQPDLCYSCHLDIKPQFSKPFHHRVNENLVKCTDCHNQHGGFLTKQLRSTAAQDVVCANCHADKAGPFVYEHAAVKIEGCLACHLPHGSSNPRLLTRSQVNVICLECHTLTVDSNVPGVPSFHNQAQKYQACTVCHAQIHGSNSDPAFFK